ncbi:hypothetical protein PFISCL1PPCAC_1496, partial [Pristionchus fissidentatus]
PSKSLNDICLTQDQMMVNGSLFEYLLQRYIFPVIAIFGILGNILNLTVLLNKNMRSRANTFLSVLAFADIIFLTLLFPNIFANYSMFTFNFSFRFLYFHSKVHLISLANWCSAIAIWCVILVCTDRLVGIRNPLYVRGGWGRGKMPMLLASVIAITGSVTAYQHVQYECIVRLYCNETQLYSRCMLINNNGSWLKNMTNPYSEGFRAFLDYSTLLYVFSMILFPIVLLTILNVMLLCALRQRHQQFGNMGNSISEKRDSSAFAKTEHRVTMTVTCIVTMFTLTNGPSALWHLIKTAYQLDIMIPSVSYNVTMLCSTLVICGKASNFIVFCLGSKHFRIRLMKLAQKKVHKKMGELAVAAATSTERSYIRSCSLGRKVLLISTEKRPLTTVNTPSTPPLFNRNRRTSSLPRNLIQLDDEQCDILGTSRNDRFADLISSNFDNIRNRRQSIPSLSSPRTSISVTTRTKTRSSVGSAEAAMLIPAHKQLRVRSESLAGRVIIAAI